MTKSDIDPAVGQLDLRSSRTLERSDGPVSVVVPAHNEESSISGVVSDARESLRVLGVEGEVIVSASACTDNTADLGARAGARVIQSALGKGNAIADGIANSSGSIICLIDGDFEYFGDQPLAVALLRPILAGTADATIADLYWRPIYPQLWFYGFFAPLAGRLYPELLAKAGTTPWSGQRAARRELWPDPLLPDFRVDLQILLAWNEPSIRLRSVVADDWMNPQRPKPELLFDEFALLIESAVRQDRLSRTGSTQLHNWLDEVHALMARYQPGADDPQNFEQALLSEAIRLLDRYTLVDR